MYVCLFVCLYLGFISWLVEEGGRAGNGVGGVGYSMRYMIGYDRVLDCGVCFGGVVMLM
jgi:hypothetical protein